MTSPLQLTKNAFGRHLPLEMLDRALEPTITHVNFNWLALYGLDHERFFSLQERRRLTQHPRRRKEGTRARVNEGSTPCKFKATGSPGCRWCR